MATPPTFTAGSVLTAAQMNAAGLWLITPSSVSGTGVSLSGAYINFSASTEIIVNGVFSSDFRNYRVVWDGQFSAGGSTFSMQYRTTSTTAANYTYSAILGGGGNPTGSTQTALASIRVGANDANGWNFLEATINCPNLAQSTRSITSFVRNNGANCEQTWGAQTDSTQFTGLRLSIGSGNMTGQMQVYGYR